MLKYTKETLKILYDILMALLSIVAAFMLIISSSYNLSKITTYAFEIMDNIILLIFAIDYFIRLYLAKDKKTFFKHNIIDLIAILPFDLLFQTARLLKLINIFKLAKLLMVLKLFKTAVLLMKFRKHVDKFLKTNNLNYTIWITLTMLLTGTIGIHFLEGITYGNDLWWSFVTLTTVGYGDISPSTPAGKILASFLMLVGIGFISMLTGTISTFFLTKNTNPTYRNETINNIKNKLDNSDKLNSEDIDDIYRVLKALKN
ncbi:ion transporter [Clostridium magnum]|uniref:pH-gated potassium channel KcsA n=1 Tax=Clostridium magnum DSM 2767 TaxID=1121326 RepID=A0A161XDU5_9CLOT|nr:potassium channel family protein [Clostridium magnum]KZL92516.1 pH-gated potassium channel KcsA [Clostridium magnum DSM 2767]SHI22868.1 voltage-gated potassium channel [Clostridium magnum DSM 2767]